MPPERDVLLHGDVSLDALDDPPHYVPHQVEFRKSLTNLLRKLNAGVCATLMLVMGATGAQLDTHTIFLVGMLGAVAGALALALGDFINAKTTQQMKDRDITLEKEHFRFHREQEIEEVRMTLRTNLHLEGELLENVTDAIGANDEALMKFMIAFEFGLDESNSAPRCLSLANSCLLFLLGGLPCVVPYASTSNVDVATVAACVAAALVLLMLGAVKTRATSVHWISSSLENLVVVGTPAALLYGVGYLFHLYYE